MTTGKNPPQNYKVIDWWRKEEKEHNCSWGAGANERKMRFPSTLVRLIPNGFGRGGFREAAYLAAEFAVLKAMQGENNKKRQQPSFTTERQRRNDIQNKRWIHRVPKVGPLNVPSQWWWPWLLPMYLARSSRRSLASFCRCSELIESVRKKEETSVQSFYLEPAVIDSSNRKRSAGALSSSQMVSPSIK